MSDSDLEIDDDDDEQQEQQQQQFALASAYVASRAGTMDAKDLLEFYGLYKQATEGACCTARPNVLQMRARSKWYAWHQLGEMSSQTAQVEYVRKLHKFEPNWLDNKKGNSAGGRPSGWVVHSIESMPVEDNSTPEHLKTPFDYVKENNLLRLREKLQAKDLQLLDDQGMALLHWATDRNAIEIIEYLVESGANVNQLDGEQQTPLHYAASCGHVEALGCLLALNANLELRDESGQTCLDVAEDEQIINMLNAELQLRRSFVAN